MDNKASRPPVKAAKGGLRKSPLDLSEAELIGSSLLSRVTGEKTDYRLRVIYAAAMDGRINNASLRHMIFRQMASDWASGKCHAHRQEYFALIEGVTTRSIITAEGQLEGAGYLSIERRRRETSSVSIIAPGAVSALVRSILDMQFPSHQEPEVAVDVKNSSLQGALDVKEISPVDVKIFSPSKEKREKEDEEEDIGRECASEPDLEIFESFKSLPHPIATERHFERWHDIGNRWGQSLGVVALHHPVSRGEADRLLLAMLDAFAGEPADTLRQAFAATMAELAGRILGRQTSVGFSAMANYARNTLKTEIAKLKLDAEKLESARRQEAAVTEIAISKEKTIADQGIAAHAAAVEAGAKAREARTAAPKEDWRDRKASARTAAFGILADRKAARAADPIGQAIAQGGDERIIRAVGPILLAAKASADQAAQSGEYLLSVSEAVSEIDGVDDETLAWAAKSIRDNATSEWRPAVGAVKKGIEGRTWITAQIAERKAAADEIMTRWETDRAQKKHHMWQRLGVGNIDENAVFRRFCEDLEDEYKTRIRANGYMFYNVLMEIRTGKDKLLEMLRKYKATWTLEASNDDDSMPASVRGLKWNR